MGTTHEVYQLQPKVISNGAILTVKKDARDAFLKRYPKDNLINQPKAYDMWGLFSNIFAIDTFDGKVPRVALYSKDRVIDCYDSGIYLSIQCGSKYGFCEAFNDSLSKLAPLLEDAVFYVIWDCVITRYNIQNAELTLYKDTNFSAWNYDFSQYIKTTYRQTPTTLANFYMDEVIEFKLFHEDLTEHNDDIFDYLDAEDYQEQLVKIPFIKEHVDREIVSELENWLLRELQGYSKLES